LKLAATLKIGRKREFAPVRGRGLKPGFLGDTERRSQ